MVTIATGIWAGDSVPTNIQSYILNMKGVHGFGFTNNNQKFKGAHARGELSALLIINYQYLLHRHNAVPTSIPVILHYLQGPQKPGSSMGLAVIKTARIYIF